MAHKIENTTNYTEQQLEYSNKMQAVCDKAKIRGGRSWRGNVAKNFIAGSG